MMTTQRPTPGETSSTPPVWERWLPVWHCVFYGALILAMIILLIGSSYSWQEYLAIFGLSTLLAGWYLCCVLVSPAYWEQHTQITLLYLALGWLLWLALIIPFPIYLFLLTGLYPQAFNLPRTPWKFIAGLALTLISLWRQFVEFQSFGALFFFSLGAGIGGCVLGLFTSAVIEQSQQRQRLLRELEQTRQELAKAERLAGTMEERQRLAREIHDTLAQGFTSIIRQLEAAEALAPNERAQLQHSLQQARRTAGENLGEARRLMWALQPEAFDNNSLPTVLTDLARHWEAESAVATQIAVTGTAQTLLPEIEVTVLRAAQEALNNTRKHAQASHVTMTLSYMDDMVALDVQDDGIGFEPACLLNVRPGQTSGRFGLKALRERVEQWSGTFSLESAPGEGTTLALALPALSNVAPASRQLEEHV